MKLHTLDPMQDRRWDELVASHSRASVFHQRGWLKALALTYGYRPLVLTSTPEGRPLTNGVVFGEIKSWITGSRLVSLPFADHCEPLLDGADGSFELSEWLRQESETHKWKYIEFRPRFGDLQSDVPLEPTHSFWFHKLSVSPSIERIFSDFHKNCIQRRIRRAEREHLSYENGSTEEILGAFYRLLMVTRRRHQLLPQPLAWFRNLIGCLGPDLDIRLARKDGLPIAAILTLRHGRTVVYKYGCSDESYHHLAAMPFLFWKLIEESKFAGAEEIDFGRTDLENESLAVFKDRFGATRSRLTYVRYSMGETQKSVVASYLPAARRLFSVLPSSLSSRAGALLYRHIG